MKQIPLTRGQVALVDDWHYEELSQWKWYAHWEPKTKSFYAVRMEGKNPRREVRMHRQVAGTPKGLLCDHKNRNTLDNQEHNLRNATNSQNMMNSPCRSDNKLGEKCISRHYGGYLVRVYKNKRSVFCKTFRTLYDAIAARDVAVSQFHGEYSYQGNFERTKS